MKSIKMILWLYTPIILVLLLVLGSPASAQTVTRGIVLEPDRGKVGDRITVTGTGFNKSTEPADKFAAIYFSSQEATTMDDIGTDTTSYEMVNEGVWLDEDGNFKVKFTVPSNLDDGKAKTEVMRGTYYVYVCHYADTKVTPRIRAIAEFTVVKGEITLSPTRGSVGTLLEVSGTGFPPKTNLTFAYDNTVVPIESGNKRTGAAGSFITVIRIPESIAGSHKVSAIAGDTEVSATFRVRPEITIIPTSGETNSLITVSGTGFGSKTEVTLWFQDVKLAATMTSAMGSFSRRFNVPDLEAGIYTVEAEGEANIAKVKFTIGVPPAPSPALPPTYITPPPPPTVSISATDGHVGQGVVISGAGFRAGGMIAVKYDDKIVATTTADAYGIFAASFAVPIGKYGKYTITASDGTNVAEIAFTVESIPPPIPTQMAPETGAKLKAPIAFYWSPVNDNSQPMTYTLQVATNKQFSTGSVLIEREGLSKIEYTITEREQQKLTNTGTPYYWRVRAVDSASNEGHWTNAGAFYTDTAFPSWALYTLIAIGGVILFVLGYLVHIRPKLFGRKES